jgi:hypothetical protein
VAFVITDVSEEYIAYIIRVTRVCEVGTTLVVISNSILRSVLQLFLIASVPSSLILSTLIMQSIHSSETSALTRTRRCYIPEYGILHSHRRENLNSYIALTGWTL